LIEADQVVVESQPLNLTELLAGLKTSYEHRWKNQ
jgi:hypothetical protein